MGPKQVTRPPTPPQRPDSTSPVHSTEISNEQRTLPSKELKADTVEDDYVQFIMYCNPSIPTNADTTELRRNFQSMPKTDGKTFNIFTLFELVQKLETKEIETWQQLVINMGVAPPDISSGQSTQKVQQYAVRLKRWLHASHVDAFFQYCLNKPNSYYSDIPLSSDGPASTARDGVPPDEDLALRALLPELRPKRGRRPNDEGLPSPGTKRPLRAAPWAEQTPVSALLQTASPWDRHSTPRDIWAAARRPVAAYPGQASSYTSTTAQEPQSLDNGNLSFDMDLESSRAIPQSAVSTRAPMSAFPTSTPQSAHPISSRSRKRHGPSVSAAWSTDATPSGKIRGRPPANRTIQDGPFSTFPARQTPPPPSSVSATIVTDDSAASTTANLPGRASPSQPRKPSKLQLQVPHHSGGPVRLATPPPKVLLNGPEGASRHIHERRSSADFINIDDDPSELGESEYENLEGDEVYWKRRAFGLQRKVKQLEAELKGVKKRVLEAIM